MNISRTSFGLCIVAVIAVTVAVLMQFTISANDRHHIDSSRQGKAHAEEAFFNATTVTEPIYADNDLHHSVSYNPGERGLIFHSVERAPGDTALNDISTTYFSTSYKIHKVAPAGQSHKFFVNGSARNGDDVLEFWEVTTGAGGRFVSPTSPAQPIGVPSGLINLNSGIVGGTYIAPIGRTEAVTVERTELFRGSNLGGFQGMAGDPNARFALVMAGGSLYRIEVGPTLVPPVEITTQFNQIAQVVYVQILELAATSERTLLLTVPAGIGSGGFADPLYYLAFDSDNDGVFEFPGLVLDEASFFSAGLFEPPGSPASGWSSNYVEFYD